MTLARPDMSTRVLQGAPSVLRSLSIVLPCHDEAANVADAIRDAHAAGTLCSATYEIIVVDDGSTDETAAIAARFVAADARVRLVVHARNRGYGDALRSGIRAAEHEWVLLVDADRQFDLRELADFVPLTGGAEAIWGYRILRNDAASRRAAGAAWSRAVRALYDLPVRDVDCGFKLIRRDVLPEGELQAEGAVISTELAVRCRAAGARIREVGVHHRPRVAGQASGLRRGVVLRALAELATTYPALRRCTRATR